MSKALSVDLRVRVLAAIASGLTHRQAGERFGGSAASVSRWRKLAREQGAQPWGAIDLFDPDECENYFSAAGYDAT